MSFKNKLSPPKPPKTLGFTSSKRSFFTKMLFSLGLKHEHIEDFNVLEQLKGERSDSVIDDALDYQTIDTKKISDTNSNTNKDLSITINDIKQENNVVSIKTKETPFPKLTKKINFSKDLQSPLDSGKHSIFSQDTEYTFKKSLDDKFLRFDDHFDDRSESKELSSWTKDLNEDVKGQNNFSQSSEELDITKNKKNSLFTKELDGEST